MTVLHLSAPLRMLPCLHALPRTLLQLLAPLRMLFPLLVLWRILPPPSGFVDEVTPPSYSALGFVPSRLPFLRYAKDIAPPHCSEDVLPALLRVALPVDLISLRAPTSRGTCPGLIMTMYFALDQGPLGVVRSVIVVPK